MALHKCHNFVYLKSVLHPVVFFGWDSFLLGGGKTEWKMKWKEKTIEIYRIWEYALCVLWANVLAKPQAKSCPIRSVLELKLLVSVWLSKLTLASFISSQVYAVYSILSCLFLHPYNQCQNVYWYRYIFISNFFCGFLYCVHFASYSFYYSLNWVTFNAYAHGHIHTQTLEIFITARKQFTEIAFHCRKLSAEFIKNYDLTMTIYLIQYSTAQHRASQYNIV